MAIKICGIKKTTLFCLFFILEKSEFTECKFLGVVNVYHYHPEVKEDLTTNTLHWMESTMAPTSYILRINFPPLYAGGEEFVMRLEGETLE